MNIKKYKTKSCFFDDSDGFWCADIDTDNSNVCPKIGEVVDLDGSEIVVEGIQGYQHNRRHNFSIKFKDEVIDEGLSKLRRNNQRGCG